MSLEREFKRVLLIDDDMIARVVHRSAILELGCEIIEALNGQEGLEIFKKQHFDLVLTDLNMPVMDGITATQAIRQLESAEQHVPIIGITSHVDLEIKAACLSAGMDMVISKPINSHQLRQDVKNILDE